jgi:glutamate racemase
MNNFEYMNSKPIGVFDSGYGGLTILKEIVATLPQYDYIYLGDNARTPYGTRSFETVYQYTLECVEKLFAMGCELVILACNTASAKALRTIQQNDLPNKYPNKRVLGVIRPTSEILGNYTTTNQIGLLATKGTVDSQSYKIELQKFFPKVTLHQQACPMWVPLIENNEFATEGANFFIKKDIDALLQKNKNIDTILLACTHYPIIQHIIQQHLPTKVKLITQGSIVATSLANYLQRHNSIEIKCTKGATIQFYTTDNTTDFDNNATLFWGSTVQSRRALENIVDNFKQ